MDWKIDYLEKDAIVSAKITGVMTWDEHMKFAQELFPHAIKLVAHKILIDFREMTPKFSILQIDDLPKLLKEIGVGPEFRIAAVHDPSSPYSHEFTFFRNVATITQLKVKQFPDADEALVWLRNEP